MSLEKTTCPDFARDFDGYLDGELDPERLRAMAFHAEDCAACGADLGRAEEVQRLFASAVEARVAEIDTSGLWASIARDLDASPKRGTLELARDAARRLFAAEMRLRPLPALALSGALAALVAFWLWPGVRQPAAVEVANNHAQIERIESSAPHVAVWSEPERHTTAIWVASYDPDGAP
jgi:anti-sigma factor RsiW